MLQFPLFVLVSYDQAEAANIASDVGRRGIWIHTNFGDYPSIWMI